MGMLGISVRYNSVRFNFLWQIKYLHVFKSITKERENKMNNLKFPPKVFSECQETRGQ